MSSSMTIEYCRKDLLRTKNNTNNNQNCECKNILPSLKSSPRSICISLLQNLVTSLLLQHSTASSVVWTSRMQSTDETRIIYRLFIYWNTSWIKTTQGWWSFIFSCRSFFSDCIRFLLHVLQMLNQEWERGVLLIRF